MERKRRDWPPVINEHVTSLWAEINNGTEVAYSVSKWILIKLWSSVWDSHETWGTSLSALGRVRRVALVSASCSLAANGSRPALMIVWSMKLYHAEGYQNCSALYCVVPNKHAHMSTLVRAYTVWFFWFFCVLFGCCLVLSTSAINCLERPLDARLYSLTIGWVFLVTFCIDFARIPNTQRIWTMKLVLLCLGCFLVAVPLSGVVAEGDYSDQWDDLSYDSDWIHHRWVTTLL